MVDHRTDPKMTRRRQKAVTLIKAWERKFRSDFACDCGARFEPLIERFGLEVDAEGMLEGTIDFVAATTSFAVLDGVEICEFLADQCYDGQAPTATYSLTFDVASRGVARLLVTPRLRFVDLADLYDYPWDRLKLAGFSHLWVSRLDGKALVQSELEELERLVTDDIRFDFGDDEVWIGFDPDTYDKALAIAVYDAPGGLSQSAESLS